MCWSAWRIALKTCDMNSYSTCGWKRSLIELTNTMRGLRHPIGLSSLSHICRTSVASVS